MKQYTVKEVLGKDLKEGDMIWIERYKPDLIHFEHKWVKIDNISNFLSNAIFLVKVENPLTANTDEEVLMTQSLKDFKKKYPSITSGDMQTFILGFKDGFMAGRQSCNKITDEKTRAGAIEIVMNTGTRGAELIVDALIEKGFINQSIPELSMPSHAEIIKASNESYEAHPDWDCFTEGIKWYREQLRIKIR